MPGLNKTGPDGQGAMTGKGFGYCTVHSNPKLVSNFFGRGMGRGRKSGRGLGLGFRGGRGSIGNDYPYSDISFPTLTKEEELHLLKAQAKRFENEMKEIQNRISELGKSEEIKE